jgi:aminoglycoside phosphotransferase (APT) family kinase protein
MPTDLHGLKFDKSEIETFLRHLHIKEKVISYTQLARGIMNFVAEVKVERRKPFILKISSQEKKYSLEKEIYLITLLEKKIPVSKIIAYDYSKKRFPYELLIQEKLSGANLQDLWGRLPRNQQVKIAYELGKILGKIHTIRFRSFGYIVGYNKFVKFPNFPQFFLRTLKTPSREHKKLGFLSGEEISRVKRTLVKYTSLLRKQKNPVLVHNDLWFEHVFVKKAGKNYHVEGIIDWGFAEISTKECDFVKPHRWIFDKGKDIEEAFMKGYSRIQKLSKDFNKLILLYRMVYDFWFIMRLVKAENIKLAKEYRTKLNYFLNALEMGNS